MKRAFYFNPSAHISKRKSNYNGKIEIWYSYYETNESDLSSHLHVAVCNCNSLQIFLAKVCSLKL